MALRTDCPFCRVVRGDTPVTRVFEDEQLLAFFDQVPLNKGQLIVVPKVHYSALPAVPPDLQGQLTAVASRLGVALMRVTDSDGFNLIIANGACAGQLVPHAYVTVVPRRADDGILMPARAVPCSPAELAQLKTRIEDRLKRDKTEPQSHDE